MASATSLILKPSSTPNITNLLSHSTSFTSKNLSIPSKPIKFRPLFVSSFSLTNKKTQFSSIISFVAQNPQTQFVVEETEKKKVDFVWEDDDEVDGDSGSPISDWEGEGEDSSIQATIEEIGEGGDEVFSEEGEDDDDDDGVDDGEVLSEEFSEEAKIFVANLPYDFDHQGLAHLFNQAGTVEIAEVIYNRDTNQSRGFGFVTMRTVEEAEIAVEKFHGHTVGGRTLTVNKAAPRGSRAERSPRSSEPALKIYVGNLPWDVDSGRLEQIFSEHGNVVEARVVSDRETGRSRGFGFVTMSSQTEMDGAISALDGESVNGRAIRVNVAEERPRRSFY